MEYDTWSDERLLTTRRAHQAGACFAAFYRRHERLIAAFHMRRVRDADIATELTAETFAQALSARPRFKDRGDGSAARWLYRIARNVLAYAARTAASEQRKVHELEIHVNRPDEQQRSQLEALQEEDSVLRALEQLPADQRAAVRAYVLEDVPYAELAQRSGRSEATIRKRVSRGLATLRKQTEETS